MLFSSCLRLQALYSELQYPHFLTIVHGFFDKYGMHPTHQSNEASRSYLHDMNFWSAVDMSIKRLRQHLNHINEEIYLFKFAEELS